ncbi:MAG: 50S ribosomal protein L4 [Thiothrix sp.]|nr:MAG: 50S ribosomal protein L4 [Thiothrix sp.]
MDIQIVGGGTVSLEDKAFGVDYNPSLIHQAVTAFMAAGRAGTKAQKNRAAVRGGGVKPWRQKGTGRARAGTIRSPIWRSGGVTFAAQPRDYSQKLNKKMYRVAICSILSELIREERIVVVEGLDLASHKTKDLAKKLLELKAPDVFIVTEQPDKNLMLAARNLPHVDVSGAGGVNPVSLLRNKKVLITKAALAKLEEWLG